MKHWPKLSETLDGPKHPDVCQSCGAVDRVIQRWCECDEKDHETNVIVCLCPICADKLIEPHPRLYVDMPAGQPHAGSMQLCVKCRHRVGVSCPLSKHGETPYLGRGVQITFPKPGMVHIDGRDKKGKRFGRWQYVFPGPPTACDAREECSS